MFIIAFDYSLLPKGKDKKKKKRLLLQIKALCEYISRYKLKLVAMAW